MSANSALLQAPGRLASSLSPQVRAAACGQSHRIPVRVQINEFNLPATLVALDDRHCRLELAPGSAAQLTAARPVALSFLQSLHRPAVPVWLPSAAAPTGTHALIIDVLGSRPAFLSQHDGHTEALPASARSPVFFNRRFEVQVGQLSPLSGELWITRDDPGLLPGIDLDLQFNCRWSGPCTVRVQLLDVYLYQGRRTAHFRVLECRLAANRHYGRLGEVEDARNLWDEFDPFAIQVAARLGRKCVGAGRVVINEGHRERCEIEMSTPLPSWLWAGGFVEMSRVAIKPEYSGHRVMLALLRELGRISLSLRSRYIVLDAIEALVPIYTRLGARCLPICKQHPYSGEQVRIMYFDVGQLLASLDRGLAHWLYVFGPTVEHSIQRQNVRDIAAASKAASGSATSMRGSRCG